MGDDCMDNSNSNSREITLSRTLGLMDITMIGIGAMIGAGIFVLIGIAAGYAGPSLPIAFLLNGIVTTFTALSYAELGSSIPAAGGGFLWVKEGLGGTQGFLAGWMNWFAYIVACALYGLGFGRLATELWIITGVPLPLSEHQLSLVFMIIVVGLFAYINSRGASEAGLAGSIVTIAKVVILSVFIGFGLYAMLNNPSWSDNFSAGMLPNGIGGVFVAMGMTFIAFEGYEIIAQSGEEVKNPAHNIPRAIFYSIGAVVIIYILIGFVVIGAVTPPSGSAVWQYLAQAKEVAIVRAAEQFIPMGGMLILISGLASTMSALNATIYSSSRVSFAMGRERNLPSAFAFIHPRMHTPYWAIFLSSILVVVMGFTLPIDQIAAAANVMFLLLFTQVNIAVMTLRRRRPNLERGFKVPLFPWPAVIGIISNLAMAVFLAFKLGQVGLLSVAWIGVGLLLYWGYFSKKEEEERPNDVLHEEALTSVDYSVLLPVSDLHQAQILGRLGSILAKEHDGEVLALHVVKVPRQLQLNDGRLFLRERRPYIDKVIEQARVLDVPVHSMIRLGRSISDAILKTVHENKSDVALFGWPGFTGSRDQMFGSVIDRIASNPPTDIAILRHRPYDELQSILVPVAGGPNGRLAVSLAIALARNTPESTKIVLLHVSLSRTNPKDAEARAQNAFRRATEGRRYESIEKRIILSDSPSAGILEAAVDCDMIVMGATRERLFRNILVGNVSEQIADKAHCPVLIVKRRSTMVASMLRETVLS
ncbi:MAG: amino acid transporter [Anaerolineaceae bacterium]|nr:amino acid transporter [Anaerolineaceae bacterium]